jgi:hypothetical protein
MNIRFKIIFKRLPVIITLMICSCKKVDLKWDIERNSAFDSKQNVKTSVLEVNSCESLTGFSTYSNVSSSSIGWQIGDGYTGNGLLVSSAKGGHIQFNKVVNEDVVITFWTKSMNPGFSNRFPEVFINGNIINSSLIEGKEDYGKWMKIQTAQLPIGNCTIKILFSTTTTFYNLYIDEISIIK